jgi:serine protease Do
MKHDDSKQSKEPKIATGTTPSVSSVSSANKRAPRTYTFTVPTLPRPNKPQPLQAWMATAAVVFLLLAFVSGYGGAALQHHNDSIGLVNTSGFGKQKKVVTSQSQLISQIAKTVGPSVVSVNVNITSATSNSSGSFGLFGFSQPSQEQAAGTGIIISSNGLILTNRHVVPEGTTSVSITLADGTELKDVSVLGRTSNADSLDIAFLKVNNLDGHKLSPAAIGDSSAVQVGDDVVAIGNALGQFQNTVTSGIISGYGRSVQAGSSGGSGLGSAGDTENLDNLFQTDAAINEGNSGGPLVNLNGQVIGINTAIAGGAQNVGFSIPINDVRGLINQVLKTGKFSRPYLGVRYIPLTADVANQYNLSVQNGAYVAPAVDAAVPSVVAGSPAESAGLQEKDIITEIDGTKIDQTHSLTSLLDQHQPGDKVSLTIVRASDTQKIDVTLGTAPSPAQQ